VRLDQYLVEQGFVDSRNKAQGLIKEGKVCVEGNVCMKPSLKIEDENVEVDTTELYVSRSAWKLKGFLPKLSWNLKGLYALDIGSSTGGFTQVLLEEGVLHVDAVDVGSDQLHSVLREDERVTSIEHTDIRNFFPQKQYDIIVSDVSFISLHNIIDDIHRLAREKIILLFSMRIKSRSRNPIAEC